MEVDETHSIIKRKLKGKRIYLTLNVSMQGKTIHLKRTISLLRKYLFIRPRLGDLGF